MEHFADANRPFTLDGYHLDRRNGIDVIEARIARSGQIETIRGSGEGAIEAFVNAWTAAYGTRINVVDYSEHTLGSDTSAEAVAYVQLNFDGQPYHNTCFQFEIMPQSLPFILARDAPLA